MADRTSGGWDAITGEMPSDIATEIEQAFANVQLTLEHAGGKGWAQVFRITSYHTDMTQEMLGIMARCAKKWMPDHKPIWTAVGVAKLGLETMRVEIEVVAHVADESTK